MPHPPSNLCGLVAEITAHFVKANKRIRTFCGMAFCLLLSACHQQQESPKKQTAVFRLFDLFQPDDLAGKVTPDDAGWKRTEWRTQDMGPWTPPPKTEETNAPQPAMTQVAALGFRALQDLDEPKIEQGQLTGDITGPAPILDFALKENRGGAESV